MSMRDRCPKVSKALSVGQKVLAKHPHKGTIEGKIVHPPFKYTAIVEFPDKDLWHVCHADIEPKGE